MSKHKSTNDIVAERFWSKVQKTDSCWLWLGAVVKFGHGHLRIRRKYVYAHRVSWEMINGPIPSGVQVLHNCPNGDNPACVNPAHLWLGTQLDNMMDMHAKGRAALGERVASARLTADAVREIRARYLLGGISYQKLADQYGVTAGAVYYAISRKTWRHVI